MAALTLDWLHIVTLLGATQGIILTAVLAGQRRNRTANRLLAVAMFAFSIHLASAVYLAAGLEQVFPHFFGLSYPFLLLYGPVIYLYAVCASDRTRQLRWQDWLHFLPFLITVAWGMPIYLKSGPEKLAFYHDLQQGIRPPVMVVMDPLKYVSGISYAVATILFLRRHRARVRDNYSTLERVNLRWLILLAGGGAAIWVLATTLQLLEVANHSLLRRSDDLVSLAMAVLVYAIGYMALRQPEIFNYVRLDVRIPGGSTGAYPVPGAATGAHRVAARPVPGPATGAHRVAAPPDRSGVTPPVTTGLASSRGMAPSDSGEPRPVSPGEAGAATPTEATPPPPGGPAGPKYERSGLGEAEAAELKEALLSVMDRDRPYQDGALTLADLAERLETTPHKLSEILNSQLEQTFYDFVNAYRVQEVQRRIADERYRNLTVLALAMDAGFASKSTFNQVFKKHTGQTPSAYRRGLAR